MSKKKITEKKQIKRSESHITNEVAIAVQEFTNIQHGMTMVEIIEKAQLILNECGPDATIEVNYSDYWGSSVELFWHRLETDEEVTKRLEKSEKAKIAARKAAQTRKIQKEKHELAELDRLQKKYAKKGN